MTRTWFTQIAVVVFAAVVLTSLAGMHAQVAPAAVAVDNDDIGGVVMGTRGPEAGVWVIAETRDTPTHMIKIVATDDQGRYLLPDLPKANYDVWVRGYGLVDSPKVKAAPGKTLNLTAVPAPDKKAAVNYYPALYWFSLLRVPPKTDFPGTGPNGNGISPTIHSQGEWIRQVVNTDGCTGCHQMGNKATREIPKNLGAFDSAIDAWDRRIQSGQAGGAMSARFTQVGRKRALQMYADWTDRIAAGELPDAAPSRPQGKERNVVVTLWDWADPKVYLHDEISSDKRNPIVNPNGPIYGALEASADYLPVVDPVKNTSSMVKLTYRDPDTPSEGDTPPAAPSPYWGDEVIWTSRANAHSFAMDEKGRVWIAARMRANQTKPYCQDGSNIYSKAFPIKESGRQMQMYDPKTKQVTTVDTCFGTHHLNFDKNGVLWFTGGGQVEGWFDTKIYDKTHDEKAAQGWTAIVLDSNGNGKRDDYVEPDQPLDPKKDKRINAGFYGVAPSPVDDSVWGSVLGMPGALVRLTLGSNPPATTLAEYYEVPWNNPKASAQGFAPRGMDVDSNGVVWTTLSSGQLGAFDRRKCKGPLNGPQAATGQHCPEGWTLYNYPGPNYKGAVENGSADEAYYNFVDRFDLLGLGKDVPIATGNLSEGLLPLVDGKFMTLRVPYPMGFYAKGIDGRIDNPKAGWKGKGIYTTFATRAPFHTETGKGTTSKLVKFQVRPDPLAK